MVFLWMPLPSFFTFEMPSSRSNHLVDSVDSFEWMWTFNKAFSARSAYMAFFEGRTTWPLHLAKSRETVAGRVSGV